MNMMRWIMKIFNCLLGLFSIMGALYCIFYPGITFLNSGWIVTILLGLWGICSVIDFVLKRKSNNNSKSEAAIGALGFIGGIAAAVVSVLSMFMPGIRILLDVIILCIFAGWLIVSGITSVVVSLKVKKTGSKRWILTLICGILVLLAGIYGIFHLIFIAQTIGVLIGILLLTYGFRLIATVFENY